MILKEKYISYFKKIINLKIISNLFIHFALQVLNFHIPLW
jgi:hypothetical protein